MIGTLFSTISRRAGWIALSLVLLAIALYFFLTSAQQEPVEQVTAVPEVTMPAELPDPESESSQVPGQESSESKPVENSVESGDDAEGEALAESGAEYPSELEVEEAARLTTEVAETVPLDGETGDTVAKPSNVAEAPETPTTATELEENWVSGENVAGTFDSEKELPSSGSQSTAEPEVVSMEEDGVTEPPELITPEVVTEAAPVKETTEAKLAEVEIGEQVIDEETPVASEVSEISVEFDAGNSLNQEVETATVGIADGQPLPEIAEEATESATIKVERPRPETTDPASPIDEIARAESENRAVVGSADVNTVSITTDPQDLPVAKIVAKKPMLPGEVQGAASSLESPVSETGGQEDPLNETADVEPESAVGEVAMTSPAEESAAETSNETTGQPQETTAPKEPVLPKKVGEAANTVEPAKIETGGQNIPVKEVAVKESESKAAVEDIAGLADKSGVSTKSEIQDNALEVVMVEQPVLPEEAEIPSPKPRAVGLDRKDEHLEDNVVESSGSSESARTVAGEVAATGSVANDGDSTVQPGEESAEVQGQVADLSPSESGSGESGGSEVSKTADIGTGLTGDADEEPAEPVRVAKTEVATGLKAIQAEDRKRDEAEEAVPVEEKDAVPVQAQDRQPGTEVAAVSTTDRDTVSTGIIPPTFDVVRVDEYGTTTIAGRTSPRVRVDALINQVKGASEVAGRSGQFAMIFSLDTQETPLEITLEAIDSNGTRVRSEESVIVIRPPIAVNERNSEETAAISAQPDLSGTGARSAEVQPAVLLAKATDVDLLQPSRIRGVGSNSNNPLLIEMIAYDQEGSAVLSGRGTADGQVHVYLDGDRVTSERIAANTTWETTLSDVDAGTYELQVEEVDNEGNTLKRVMTPFRRETSETAKQLLAAARTSNGGGPDPFADGPAELVTIQWGNTLWGISRKRYGLGRLYVWIYNANSEKIHDPDLIYPGQIFVLPPEGVYEDPLK